MINKDKIMTKKDLLSLFKCEDIRMLPEAMLPVVLTDDDHRTFVYQELLYLNDYDVSYDWFQNIYEGEQSERKEKKQDFTPDCVSRLASELTGTIDGSTYEPTAGNGSMLIADWWRKVLAHFPWDYYPSKNRIECWELSSRSIPILLLNLSIRGIVGTVHHGDVLTQQERARYELINPFDDHLSFSLIKSISL